VTAVPGVRCLDCGTDLLPGGRRPRRQWCMLTDATWSQTGLEPGGGTYLCVACTEARIGRDLQPGDLTADPINLPTDADLPRLRALKAAALAAHHRRGQDLH
jgi:hypothetical protein